MLFLMGVLALLLTTPNANADDKEKYKLFAEETRKEVWALKLPEFPTRLFPINIKMSHRHSGSTQPVGNHQKDPIQRRRLPRRISLYRP